ncbi:unnamed protein product, partial [Effrenium voratum]
GSSGERVTHEVKAPEAKAPEAKAPEAPEAPEAAGSAVSDAPGPEPKKKVKNFFMRAQAPEARKPAEAPAKPSPRAETEEVISSTCPTDGSAEAAPEAEDVAEKSATKLPESADPDAADASAQVKDRSQPAKAEHGELARRVWRVSAMPRSGKAPCQVLSVNALPTAARGVERRPLEERRLPRGKNGPRSVSPSRQQQQA